MKKRVLQIFLFYFFYLGVAGLTSNNDYVIAQGAEVVSGSAITYYVGGANASNDNRGTDSNTPFATIAKASSTINAIGSGAYEILVQGNTTEDSVIQIGNGTDQINVTIKSIVDSAKVYPNWVDRDSWILICSNASLTLGNGLGYDNEKLIFDGMYGMYAKGRFINNSGGLLNIYDGVTLKNNHYTNGFGAGVINEGTFNMYGGVISDNMGPDYGGAIYNKDIFNMYGGLIDFNQCKKQGGGVFNCGTFRLYNGTINFNFSQDCGGGIYSTTGNVDISGGIISNNNAMSGGGLYINDTAIISDGIIRNNSGSIKGAGIYTNGVLTMTGGEISNNSNDAGGGGGIYVKGSFTLTDGNITLNSSISCSGIDVEGTFLMNGGRIYSNKNLGVKVETTGVFNMTGGQIADNSNGGVFVLGVFTLSDQASVSLAGSNDYDVILANTTANIRINNLLTDMNPVTLQCKEYVIKRRVLGGDAGILSQVYSRFKLLDNRYVITEEGLIDLGKQQLTYYVGGSGASDANIGSSSESPFATLEKAAASLKSCTGTIVIQSDVVVNSSVVLIGDINIITDGLTRTVKRGNNFTGNMIINSEGTLTLGYKDNQPASGALIFDGYYVPCSGVIIYNNDTLNMNQGIVIQNNNNVFSNGGGIYTNGIFNMYGGDISSNNCSGVNNNKLFNMSGGVIEQNTSTLRGAGVYNTGHFTMTGGLICNNKGILGGGVENHLSFKMSGGSITGNTALMGEGVYSSGEFILSGDSSIAPDTVKDNDIFLSKSSLTIEGTLQKNMFKLSVNTYTPGASIINGSGLTAENLKKFTLTDNRYFITADGKIGTDLQEVSITGITIKDKDYDGTPIVYSGSASNSQVYEGDYYFVYFSTDSGRYFSKEAPKDEGAYLLVVTIPYNDTFIGQLELPFHINKKKVILKADDITVNLKDSIPPFTYHFISGHEMVAGEKLSIEPTLLTQNTVNSFVAATYEIHINGASASNNYIISYQTGLLTVKEQSQITPPSTPPVTPPITPPVTPPSTPPVTPPYIPPFVPYQPDTSNIAPIPSTEPSPTPSLVPIEENVQLEGIEGKVILNISGSKQGGIVEASIDVPKELSTSSNKTGDSTVIVTIPIASNELINSMNDGDIQKIHISITIPNQIQSNNNLKLNALLSDELINAAKEAEKDLIVAVTDDAGKERYCWSFSGEALNSSPNQNADVNLSLEVETLEDNSLISNLLTDVTNNTNQNGLIINFSHEGILPAQAKVRVYVGDQPGIARGSHIFLYHYNNLSNKLETLPYSSSYYVDKDGYISVNILHCSDYVVTSRQVKGDNVISLIEQITVTPSESILYLGGNVNSNSKIEVKIPPTLEQVQSAEDKTSQSAIGALTITYESSNEKIASVNSKGEITAKGIGKVIIYTTIELYSGKSEIFKTTITVEKPYIKITKSKDALSVGDTFIYDAEVYGLNKKDLVWTTSNKSVATVQKKTGKVTALSKGTVYLTTSINKVSVKIKIVVK